MREGGAIEGQMNYCGRLLDCDSGTAINYIPPPYPLPPHPRCTALNMMKVCFGWICYHQRWRPHLIWYHQSHLWKCTFDAYFWTIPSGADGSIMDAFASAFGLTLPRIIVKWRKRPKSSLSFEGVQTWKYWYFEASDCCWEKYFSNLGLGLLTKTSPSNLFTRVFYFPSSKQWLWFPWTNKVSLFLWKPIWFQRLRLIWLSGKYLSN